MQYIPFSLNTVFGSRIKSSLTRLELGLEEFKQMRGSMTLMLDGDGSQDAHYASMATQCGFADAATARAAFAEIDSAHSKIATDGSVSNVNAALTQLFNKLRA